MGDTPPEPGPEQVRQRFARLQQQLPLRLGHTAPTIVVLPSHAADADEMATLVGLRHYEERLLCLVTLLRQPGARLLYVTSQPIDPAIIDYYLHLLPGIPPAQARRRLTLLSCSDGAAAPLTQKILARPRLIERIRAAIPDAQSAYMLCFQTTPLEQTLAVRLEIPIYGCDPALAHLGSKSGGREVFRRAGVPMPDGFEHLRDTSDIARALGDLKRRAPALRQAVIKRNTGFSGLGNALFSYEGAPAGGAVRRWIKEELPRRLRFEAPGETWEHYQHKFAERGGIVERCLEGPEIRSPSVQCCIDPLGNAVLISTHDQMLGGPSGQIFLGCTFPADAAYCQEIQEAARRVADVLRREGALGRFGIDFLSVWKGDRWDHAAVEINLRMGGTTHPFLMLQLLTGGAYDPETGQYRTPAGRLCCYRATDNLRSPAYKGLTPDDLIDIAIDHDLRFDGETQQGVAFHLIGALSEHGKLGLVCIGDSPAAAERIYRRTVAALDRETEL